eukprot:1964307-Pleurochrysis_carterae.AAC.1
MELPSLEPLKEVLAQCEAHQKARYTVNVQGEIEWVHANSINTFYIACKEQLSKFFSLHLRGLER